MICQLAVSLAVVATASASYSLHTEDHATQKVMWESFKAKFNRKYSTMEEETSRFYKFIDNLKVADQRNALEIKAGGGASHGITQFSDLSQVEFETRYLLSDPSMRNAKREVATPLAAPSTTMGLVDWTNKLTTPVKDQGYCGSCWAFSATEQIESDHWRKYGSTPVLSPEQITQCDKTSFGCGGGWTEHAFNYVARSSGLATDADYPYTSYQGVTGTCQSKPAAVTITGYTAVASDEGAMASWMQSNGPLSVCVDANNWNSYTGGIMSVCGQSVDHCVQAVGVDVGNYWKIRNSWNTGWGEGGFIRLAYGANTCAVKSDPTYVNL